MDGGVHQQSQRHQAEGDSGNKRRRGIPLPRQFGGGCGGPHRVLAPCAHEAQRTLTHWAGEVGVTFAAVVAGELLAGAAAHGAVLTREAECARAGEVVDAIDAGAAVAAGVAGAVIDIGLAARSGEAWLTTAHDTVTEVQALSTCRETETKNVLVNNTQPEDRTQKITTGRADRWKETGGRSDFMIVEQNI